MKLNSVLSLLAAVLLAISCGTAPEGYTTAGATDKLEQGEQETTDGTDSEGTSEHKDLVTPVAGGAVAIICAAIPGCRSVIKNGVIKIKDGTGKVVAVIKKPFSKLFKKTDDVADSATKTADDVVEVTEEVAETTAKNADGAEEAK